MADETPAPFWKKLVPKPSGSIPGGLLSQVAIGLIAILVGALLVSHQFCGGGEPAATAPDEQQEPVAGGGGLGRRISSMTEQQRRQGEHEERDRQRREQLSNQQMLSAGLGGGSVSRAPGGPGPTGSSAAGRGQPFQRAPEGQQFQTDAEFELMQRLRLEDIERKRRSLRVGPVVLSHRTGSSRQGDEELEETPPATATPVTGAPDPNSALQAVLGNVQTAIDSMADPHVQPAPAAAPAAPAAAAAPIAAAGANYDDPTRISAPFNPPGSERIYEGSFLEAVLVTQLSGEFTGPVLAMVALPFYSTDRQRILVPRGTRAVGTAQAVGGGNQERLAVGFHRLVFPDGRWVELKFDGLDQAGDAALKDKVNRHYLSMFAAVGAVGVLSGLTLRGSNPYSGGQAGFRAGAGQGFGQAGMQILSRFLNRHPTITIRAGHRLRIWFTSDVLVPRPPPQGGQR